jgi:hypothetical protein
VVIGNSIYETPDENLSIGEHKRFKPANKHLHTIFVFHLPRVNTHGLTTARVENAKKFEKIPFVGTAPTGILARRYPPDRASCIVCD